MNKLKQARIYTYILALLISLSSCHSRQKIIYKIPGSDSLHVEFIPISKLISSPEDYNLQLIETKGYYTSDFEKSALFKSKWSSIMNNYKDALWITYNKDVGIYEDSTSNELNCKYIIVKGKFLSDGKGHLGQYSGELDDVYFVSYIK